MKLDVLKCTFKEAYKDKQFAACLSNTTFNINLINLVLCCQCSVLWLCYVLDFYCGFEQSLLYMLALYTL